MRKTSKKSILILISILAFIAFSANAYALSFTAGDYKFVMDGASTFENPLLGPASGNLWGISQIKTIHRNAIPGGGDFSIEHYGYGDNGEFLTLRYGGLDLHYLGVGPTGYHISDATGALVPALPLPNQQYFVDDTIPHAGEGGFPKTGISFAEVWQTTVDVYADDLFAINGGVGAGGASGTYGSFGTLMAAAINGGTLMLDMTFSAGGIFVDEMVNVGVAAADPLNNFRALATSNTRNETLGYLDVTGAGAWDSQFDTDGLFAGSVHLGAVGRVDGFDIRLESSNSSATPIPLSAAMIAAGWNTRNETTSALANANPIPEPGTIFLFGIGLLGLAGITRKKRQNR